MLPSSGPRMPVPVTWLSPLTGCICSFLPDDPVDRRGTRQPQPSPRDGEKITLASAGPVRARPSGCWLVTLGWAGTLPLSLRARRGVGGMCLCKIRGGDRWQAPWARRINQESPPCPRPSQKGTFCLYPQTLFVSKFPFQEGRQID